MDLVGKLEAEHVLPVFGADVVAAVSAPVLDIIVDKSPKSPAADNKQR